MEGHAWHFRISSFFGGHFVEGQKIQRPLINDIYPGLDGSIGVLLHTHSLPLQPQSQSLQTQLPQHAHSSPAQTQVSIHTQSTTLQTQLPIHTHLPSHTHPSLHIHSPPPHTHPLPPPQAHTGGILPGSIKGSRSSLFVIIANV